MSPFLTVLDRTLWLLVTLALVIQTGRREHVRVGNWDALPYAALAIEAAGASRAEARVQAYRALEHSSDDAVAALRYGNAYKAAATDDAAVFDAQLPFYRARMVYVQAAGLLVRVGVRPYRALAVLNALGIALIALTLLVWIRHWLPEAAGSLATLLILLVSVRATAALNTPDTLVAGLGVLGGAALLLGHRRLAVMWLVLAACTRPDALLLGVALLLAAPGAPKMRALSAALVAVAGISMQWIAGAYGWSTVFYHTFAERLLNPRNDEVHVSVGLYLKSVADGIIDASVLGIILSASLAVVAIKRLDATSVVALALGAAAVLHYALFL